MRRKPCLASCWKNDTAILELLTFQRESALAEASRLRNQIHALLLQVNPEYKEHLPTINSKAGLDAIRNYAPVVDDAIRRERARAVRRLAERLTLALDQEEQLAEEIRKTSLRVWPLLLRRQQLTGIRLGLPANDQGSRDGRLRWEISRVLY